MSAPDISLVLATVGRTEELDRMFASLAAQTFRAFEVIVVDQNADERLLPHLERARRNGLSIRHLRQARPNLAAARNAGIGAATGRWVGFPDDDCWYAPDLLQRVMNRFCREDGPAGVVVRWVEQEEQPMFAVNLTWERSCAFRDIPVSSITLFCSRTLCNDIGGFDSRLGVGQWFGAGEETDFVLRALRAGALFTYEPQAEVHHAVSPEVRDATPQARLAIRCRARGTGALYAKHSLPLWVIARGLIAPVLRPLLKGAFGTDLALGCAVVLGRLDGLIGWRRRQF
ncbi:MAG TPA: glycosyltransferase family A protein [Noviherbaspirillum sp.]|nr:glycosyltransferase family A protein [Noviherbaspirillum sp.]